MVIRYLVRRGSRPQQGGRSRPSPQLLVPLLLLCVLMVVTVVFEITSRVEPQQQQHRNLTRLELELEESTSSRSSNIKDLGAPPQTKRATTRAPAPVPVARQLACDAQDNNWQRNNNLSGPYHNWRLFKADYQEMLQNLRIYVYPDAFINNQSFARVFLPHPNPKDPKLGNYFSEHAFKTALLGSSLVTSRAEEAHFFFMPFSINAMRNHPRLHSVKSISDFVAQYTNRISSEFKFWNASGGADHFYTCCHSIGREAASKHHDLHNTAIQITCSSSYFQRLFISHKDVGLPQVWPRPPHQLLNPPHARNKLVFFAGRKQNSRIREKILASWGNDTLMDIFSGNLSFPYEEGFRRSKYCLHVKGYEVNTARVSDAIHYGCIPVIISNYYDLPFANVLDWSKFSIIISEEDVAFLKKILLSVSRQRYLTMYHNLCLVRRHFRWHTPPRSYDSFYMTVAELLNGNFREWVFRRKKYSRPMVADLM
ncbi:unnamed protein product [Camellia sinensis]